MFSEVTWFSDWMKLGGRAWYRGAVFGPAPHLPPQSLKIRAGLFCSRLFSVKMKWLCVSQFLNLSSYAFLTFHLSFGCTFSFMLQYDDKGNVNCSMRPRTLSGLAQYKFTFCSCKNLPRWASGFPPYAGSGSRLPSVLQLGHSVGPLCSGLAEGARQSEESNLAV